MAGVVLLHGYGRTPASMQLLARRLRQQGYAVSIPRFGLERSMAAILGAVEPEVARLGRESDGPLHIVTHSLGGLVARALIAGERPPSLGRVVMLAPPNRGSELADWLQRLRLGPLALGDLNTILGTRRAPEDRPFLGPVDYPLGIIAGVAPPLLPARILPRPNDGKVSVKSALLPGMDDFILLNVPHSLLPLHPEAILQVQQFLARGHFLHGQRRHGTADSPSTPPEKRAGNEE